jgi:hypothetical protein
VADVAAGPISKRSPLSEEQVRALVGGVFLALSLLYVVGAVRDLTRRTD